MTTVPSERPPVPLEVLRVAPEAGDCPHVLAQVTPHRMGATWFDQFRDPEGRDATVEGWLVKVSGFGRSNGHLVIVNTEGPWVIPYRALRTCAGWPAAFAVARLDCYHCDKKILYVNGDWRHYVNRKVSCNPHAQDFRRECTLDNVACPVVGEDGPR